MPSLADCVPYTFAMLLSPREAALRLGISYPTIKQWLYRGKLKAVKTPGGHYRIPEAELDGLLHKAKRPDTPKREMLRTLSGRNQLTGRIVEIKVDGLLAQVKLSIGGQVITSIITSEAVREMRLKVGETAAALIKSTEVMVLRV
jgi:molybdopterin-binding protein